jgi:ribosomal protein S18 acetylase RimI-like enzyme
MPANFVRARPGDVDVLLALMPEYYAYDHLPFDPAAARAALACILSNDALGRVWLIQRDAAIVGYMVLTFGFSLEFHGRDAFVDELYIQAAHRGQGIGRAALRVAETACAELGIQALHLEVERVNTNAQAVYRKAGFVDHDRYLLTRWIAPEK